MLVIKCLFYKTIYWIENQFKVNVNDKRCAVGFTDLLEFDVRLLNARSGKHLKNRHDVFACAMSLMFGKKFLSVKYFETLNAYIFA